MTGTEAAEAAEAAGGEMPQPICRVSPKQTDEPQASPDGAFTDTAQHWAEGYILQMKERGAVNGFEDGSFRPDQAVTERNL